jgi:copper transport protein
LSGLTDTAYGKALLVKLAVIVPLLGLGSWNALRIGRRFERMALRDEPSAEQEGQRLARTAVLESMAGAAVVAVTAVLVFLVPAGSTLAQANAQQPADPAAASAIYRREASAAELRVSLTIDPNRAGENEFRVQLTGPNVEQAQRVQLRFQPKGKQEGGSAVVNGSGIRIAGLVCRTGGQPGL